MIIHFDAGRDFTIRAIEEAMETDGLIMLISQKDFEVAEPYENDLYEVGTIAKIRQVLKHTKDDFRIAVEGISRAEVNTYVQTRPYFMADVTEIMDTPLGEDDKIIADVYMNRIKQMCKSGAFTPKETDSAEALKVLDSISDHSYFSDVVAANVYSTLEKKQAVLAEFDVIKRLQLLTDLIGDEIQMMKLESKIDMKVHKNIDKHQKEYFLREQLKVIRGELGDEDGVEKDIDEYRRKLIEKKAPEQVIEKCEKEMERLEKMQPGSPEAGVVRTYLDWVTDIPWGIKTEENYDISGAEVVLENDHYGLKKVKERILEFLSVRKLTGGARTPIICLVGPPGVGKTSVAKSIAKATGRNYVRISLGGVRDEAEIRGHRKTYIGAMPGRIITALKKAGSSNPLILLDEIDKLSADYKGDPSSALLEVLDSEQNFAFRDHFIELDVDLSDVMFVTTANSVEDIDRPLLDRMEIIDISGYTEYDKVSIAREHLIPKLLQQHGLKKSNLRISKEAIADIINCYTREAGVRNLERKLAQVMRKAASLIVKDGVKSVSVGKKNLEDFLGKKIFKEDEKSKVNQVGVVNGLAWTQYGGDTLCVEVNCMKGTGKIELTGSLGDVMKESAVAAISFIRSRTDELSVNPDFYKTTDIHIHVPEGATPKDGPSAGITMATAVISALTGIGVRRDVAMTGEITLRGRVLPIGGLREKSLAAYRAGATTVIIPSANVADLDDIPSEVREKIEFIPVQHMDEVLKIAFEKGV
ncbi:MAG: endopeptidase La [Clostridia bacterium]|nr:endopeptidase La [Clostridia bacterium]